MTVQHADLFHCLACGRVAYEPHGGPAPDCCGQPMVRAVADVVHDVRPTRSAESGASPGVDEHALFAELVELAQWCHGLRDVDISRTEELANRLSVLHLALIDQVEDSRSARAQTQQLLATFARFVGELRNGPLPFESWVQICDRLDEVVVEFRRHVETESELTRAPSTRADKSTR